MESARVGRKEDQLGSRVLSPALPATRMTNRIEVSRAAAAGRPAVVAPPHPLYGGRMDNPVVEAVASALAEAGYAPLRFNWRGTGSSSGQASGSIEDAIQDYSAAVSEALNAVSQPPAAKRNLLLLAAGYSFGAIAAAGLALARPGVVERLVLVAPPATMLPTLDLASLECPVRVIVGACDSFAPVNALARALEPTADVRLDVVPDADHFFGMPFWIDRLRELVRDAVL